jgi:hypothetical protein
MKVRGEIPAVVQANLRNWRVHRDAFLEHSRERGMPKSSRGCPLARPRGARCRFWTTRKLGWALWHCC